MEAVVAVFIPITFLVVVGLITKWISDNRLRREINSAGTSPEVIDALLSRPIRDIESNLKWGIVSVAVGLSLVVIHFADIDVDDPLTFGLIFMFGGAALLLFYFLRRDSQE